MSQKSGKSSNFDKKSRVKISYVPLDPNPNPKFNLMRSTPLPSPIPTLPSSPVTKGSKEQLDDVVQLVVPQIVDSPLTPGSPDTPTFAELLRNSKKKVKSHKVVNETILHKKKKHERTPSEIEGLKKLRKEGQKQKYLKKKDLEMNKNRFEEIQDLQDFPSETILDTKSKLPKKKSFEKKKPKKSLEELESELKMLQKKPKPIKPKTFRKLQQSLEPDTQIQYGFEDEEETLSKKNKKEKFRTNPNFKGKEISREPSPLEKAQKQFDEAYGQYVDSPISRPTSVKFEVETQQEEKKSKNHPIKPVPIKLTKKQQNKRFDSQEFEEKWQEENNLEQESKKKKKKMEKSEKPEYDQRSYERTDSEEMALLKKIQQEKRVKKTFSLKNINDPTNFKVRVGTFNVENLYARYKFGKYTKNDCPVKGFTLDTIFHDGFMDKPAKQLTAYCIQDMNADVLAVQEIEGMQLLEKFNTTFLQDMGYKYCLVIDGHDQRQIEIGVLSRYPIECIRTNRHIRSKTTGEYLFPRDCLEVTIRVGAKLLVCYISHFTSMAAGREKSFARRSEQANKVVEIIEQRWAPVKYKGDFVVLGDFNDYYDNTSALKPLITHKALENVVTRLPKEQQWTHFYNKEGLYSQLDYILVSKSLAERNQYIKPAIWRKGLPYRVEAYTGARYSGVGMDHPKASDHCPVSIDLIL